MKEGSIDIYCSKEQLGWIVPIAADVLAGASVYYKEGYGYVVCTDRIALNKKLEAAFWQMYEELVSEIEEYVKLHRIGLPWYAEVTDPSDEDKGASLFLSESFEVGCCVRNEDGTGYGAAWTPYDLWYELEPPPPIDELLKEE